MAQFRVGTASIAKGQSVVAFTGATLDVVGSIGPNSLFSFVGENVWYQIQSVAVVDGVLVEATLASSYVGSNKTSAAYAIQRNFTQNLSLPVSEYGDQNTAGLIQLSVSTLDAALAALGQVSGPLDGVMSSTFALRLNNSSPLAERAGLLIKREGLSDIALVYTGDEPWKRWTFGQEDIEIGGRLGLGRALAGSEKLAVAGDAKIDGNLQVEGNLTVSGDTITINAGELEIEDRIIAVGLGNNGAAGYLGLKAHRGDTDAFMVFDETSDRWTVYVSNDELATRTLGSIEAQTFHGSLAGNAATANKLATARQIALTGDALGQVNFDGSGNVSLAVSLPASGVGAGTYTKLTVDAKGRVTNGGSISSDDVSTALGFVPLAPADAATANVANKLVKRGPNGEAAFGALTATTITAPQFTGDLVGTAQTAGRWIAARNLSLTGDASGVVAIDGSVNVSLQMTLANSGVSAGTYSNLIVDAKGRIVGARAINAADVTAGLGYTPLNQAGGTITGNLIVSGNLLVQGTLTQMNTTVIEVDDPIITVAKGNASAGAAYAGMKIERGASDVFLVWNEAASRMGLYRSTDDLATNKTLVDLDVGTIFGTLSGNASSATKLATARTIAGVAFDGTASIAINTDGLTEGSNNKFFTAARARASLSAGAGLAYDEATGKFSIATAGSPVLSVAGRTGDITLAMTDIAGLDTALNGKAGLAGATFTGDVAARANPSVGWAALVSGQAGIPGYVSFSTQDGVRRGFIGWKSGDSDNLLLTAENGWGWKFVGSTLFASAVTMPRLLTTSQGLGDNIALGDDVTIGDVNAANTFGVIGQQNANKGFIKFGTGASLGYDGSTLVYGGSEIHTDANAKDALFGVRNGPLLTGGGVITVSADRRVKWTDRFISIGLGGGIWNDVFMPAVGTVIPMSNGGNVTVDASGVYLEPWASLWFSTDDGFHIFRHNEGAVFPGRKWLPICRTNGDLNRFFFPNGVVLAPGQSRSMAATPITSDGGAVDYLSVQSNYPQLLIRDADGAVDKKVVRSVVDNGTFFFQTLSDAGAWLRDHFKAALDGSAIEFAASTFTTLGNLWVSKVWPSLVLNKTGSGQGSQIIGANNSATRWQLRLGNDVAEGGANAGSDFDITRHGDDGVYIDIPFSINRKTGDARFGHNAFSDGVIQGKDGAIARLFDQTRGWTALRPADSTTNAGYVEFHIGGTRKGFIGFGTPNGGWLDMNVESDCLGYKFNKRPSFAGKTPWDEENFDPRTKMRNGECRLTIDTNARVMLIPYNGNRLIIDGYERVVPSAGITLGMPAANVIYRIYAYWDGTAMLLEASQTGYQRDPNTGIMVKIGDPSKTLVGLADYDSNVGLVQGSQYWTVRSWYNDIKPVTSTYNGGTASIYNNGNWSGAYVANYILTWAGERVLMRGYTQFYARDSDLTCYQGLFFDGVHQDAEMQSAHQNWPMSARPIAIATGATETIHSIEMRHQVNGFHMDVSGLSMQAMVV